MASVSQQALLGLGANAVAGRPGWYWPLSLVPDTPIWRDHSLFSDSAWLAAIQYAASVVPKSITWQPQLSLPNYLFTRNRRLLAAMADGSSFSGDWLSSAGIVRAATPAFIGWQQELSVSRVTKRPIWADESAYDGIAWFQAASVISPAVAFLGRTSGLDATHTNAYTALINGLVTDGIWTKLDVLHIYATQDSATALLNLVSTSYNGTASGLISFSVDLGFTGAIFNGAKHINSNFNPATASSPQYVQNSAHISAWSVTGDSTYDDAIMGFVNNSDVETMMYTNNPGAGGFVFRVNCTQAAGVSVADAGGHSIANRTNSTNIQAYRNGASVKTFTTATSSAVPNGTISIIGEHNVDTDAYGGGAMQCAMASIGASLSAGDATLFYNRLRTYMTAVGVP